MVNLELSYAHYSVLLQSLLSRMDDLTSKIQFYTECPFRMSMCCILN